LKQQKLYKELKDGYIELKTNHRVLKEVMIDYWSIIKCLFFRNSQRMSQSMPSCSKQSLGMQITNKTVYFSLSRAKPRLWSSIRE
jgi:hypothetical protein